MAMGWWSNSCRVYYQLRGRCESGREMMESWRMRDANRVWNVNRVFGTATPRWFNKFSAAGFKLSRLRRSYILSRALMRRECDLGDFHHELLWYEKGFGSSSVILLMNICIWSKKHFFPSNYWSEYIKKRTTSSHCSEFASSVRPHQQTTLSRSSIIERTSRGQPLYTASREIRKQGT